MNKKLVVIVSVVLFLTIGLSGCTDEKSRFIGTWTNDNGEITLTFSDNGNCVIVEGTESHTGGWDTDGGRLGLDWFGDILVFDYAFSDGDKTLKLYDVNDGSEFLVVKR